MSYDKEEFTFEAGALIRRQYREILRDEVFIGRKIRWYESKRWLYSEFHIRGLALDLLATVSRIHAYASLMKDV